MATTRSAAQMFRGPCGDCEHRNDCGPYSELDQYLFRRREFQRPLPLTDMDQALDRVTHNFISSLRSLRHDGRLAKESSGYALSALVDFCITGIYTNGLVTSQAEFSQQAVRCGNDHAIFPYTWMCPFCVSRGVTLAECYLPSSRRESRNSVVRDYPQVDWLAKPGGRAIGDQGIQVIKSLLRKVLEAAGSSARLRDGGGARGEFDLTIATENIIAFIEVKAKPLIAYPLVVEIASSPSASNDQHEWVSLNMQHAGQLSLFLGAVRSNLPICRPTLQTVSTWPLSDLAEIASDTNKVALIVDNWLQQAKAYEEQWGNEPDHLRWHRFGCGNFHTTETDGTRIEKRVANTKELPGLDRTDDIKKGAAQVLKYSRLKFQCKKRALRAVLLGNTHALTHHNDYVAPILHLKVLNDGDDSSRAEWIFDAMVGLTRNHFNVADLTDLFPFETLLEPTVALK